MPDDFPRNVPRETELLDDVLANGIADRAVAMVVLLRLVRMGYVDPETALEIVRSSFRSEG